jgi:hypothetical protein
MLLLFWSPVPEYTVFIFDILLEYDFLEKNNNTAGGQRSQNPNQLLVPLVAVVAYRWRTLASQRCGR